MINERMTIDEAFQAYRSQFDFLETAKEKIKQFPFQEYLHVGFDAGLAKSHEYVYNMEYILPFELKETRFVGEYKPEGSPTYIKIDVPTEWARIHQAADQPYIKLPFRLTYRTDKKRWSIKCSAAYGPLSCSSKYQDKYRVFVNSDYSIMREANRVLSGDSRQKAAVSRKSDDLDFYIRLFQVMLPFLMKDELYAVKSILADAEMTKAINMLK